MRRAGPNRTGLKKLLCLTVFMQAACGVASVKPDGSVQCENLNVEISGADIARARAMFLTANYGAGETLWDGIAGRPDFSTLSRRSGQLGGESPIAVARRTISFPDVCPEPDCGDVPVGSPMLLFGCQFQNCTSRAAVFLDESHKPVAVALTTFATARLGRVSEAGAKTDPARQDLILFVENARYARDVVRSTVASWFLLESEFRPDDWRGTAPDYTMLDDMDPRLTRRLTIRECSQRGAEKPMTVRVH